MSLRMTAASLAKSRFNSLRQALTVSGVGHRGNNGRFRPIAGISVASMRSRSPVQPSRPGPAARADLRTLPLYPSPSAATGC